MNYSIKSSNLARGGIYTTLSFMCIYLSSFLPINKLFLLGLASAIIPISVITTNVKNTFLVYIATSLLSAMIIGLNRGTVLCYIIFFGLYGIIKYYIEKLNKLPIEILLKYLYFNISIIILIFIGKLFFPLITVRNKNIYIYIIISEIIFIIFDYTLTLFIFYIQKHLLHKINNINP